MFPGHYQFLPFFPFATHCYHTSLVDVKMKFLHAMIKPEPPKLTLTEHTHTHTQTDANSTHNAMPTNNLFHVDVKLSTFVVNTNRTYHWNAQQPLVYGMYAVYSMCQRVLIRCGVVQSLRLLSPYQTHFCFVSVHQNQSRNKTVSIPYSRRSLSCPSYTVSVANSRETTDFYTV